MSDIKFSGLHKLISWSHEILKLSSRKDPGKEYIPQVNSVNEGRLWGHFHLHQISTKMIIEYKTSYKMSEEKKKPSQSQSSSERGNYLEEPPTLNCLLATVKQYGGVTIKTHAFRWMEHSKVTAHITRDQWKLMPVEQNHMQGKWGCLVIFNARSIWMTGLKGWSMALAGCNEDQLTSSRKQLIVSIPDKWHPELLLLE